MSDYREQEEVFSKIVKAGRRTYFFDVKTTKAEDYYLTLTESKKFTNEDGSFHYKKHKIHLYRADFKAFQDTLKEVIDFVVAEKGAIEREPYFPKEHTEKEEKEISFEDL